MIYSLQDINPKVYEGDMIFMYGDESAERVLPLGKREVELVKGKRSGEVAGPKIPFARQDKLWPGD